MALPNFSQIVQNMITFLQGKRPTLNTTPGTVTNDVVISTVANQLSAQDGVSPSVYSGIQYTQDLQAFVDNAAILTEADLDSVGDNYGMTRNSGTFSTVIMTFRIRNYTTTSPIITVPTGTAESTLATSSAAAVSFSTTAGITFQPSLAPSYFNPLTGFYEQSTTAQCQVIGTVGNVGAQTITSLLNSVPGIDSVINTVAATGGTDKESNVAYAGRIQIRLEGNNVGTPDGILSLVEVNPSVQQAIIVGPNDPEMLRNQFGGSVDVYIKGQVLSTVVDSPTYMTAGSQIFILNHQPALSVNSITGINATTGNPYTFVAGTDYVFHENPNILFAGSTLAASYVQFGVQTFFTIISVVDLTHLQVDSTTGMQFNDTITQGVISTNVIAVIDATHVQVASTASFAPGIAHFTGFLPLDGSVLTITYTYDSLIETLQAEFSENSNHIVASDILIREAVEALINVTASILVLPGFVPPTVVTNVQTNLTTFLNGLGLGVNIDLSDLVVVIEGTPGVDEVDLSTLSMQSIVGDPPVTTTVPPGQRISVGKTAYPVANILTISLL